MAPIVVLHLLNHFGASGIARAELVRVQHLGQQGFTWHIGALFRLDHPTVTGGLSPEEYHLGEEFRRSGAQVVEFSGPHNTSGTLAKKIREYVQAHQIRLIHTHSPRTVLAAAMALYGTHGIIHLATEHLLYSVGDRRWGLIYMLLDRFSLYLPDHLVAVSQTMQRQIVSLPGMSAKRVTAIQNAIDSQSFYVPDQRDACRLEFGLTPESLGVGYAGRIDRVKRLDLLFQGFSLALARYPQARLVIAGEGQKRAQLEAFAAELGISPAVIWTGFRQDIPRVLAAMDVYVQPSANEGLSKSILEAMAAGRPVIATNVGGVQEVITNEETGLLISPGSSSAIGAAIVDLLDHPEKRLTLGRAARSHVIEQFGVQQMVEAYGQLYQALASQP